MPDGRLGIVDFGCCHPLSAEDRKYGNDMELALHMSSPSLRDSVLVAVDQRPDRRAHPEHVRLTEALADWLWEPVRHEGPFVAVNCAELPPTGSNPLIERPSSERC